MWSTCEVRPAMVLPEIGIVETALKRRAELITFLARGVSVGIATIALVLLWDAPTTKRGPALAVGLAYLRSGRLLALGSPASGVAARGPGPATTSRTRWRSASAPPCRGSRKPDLAAALSPRGRGLGPGRPPLRDDPGHPRRAARVLARAPEPVARPGRAERPGHPVLRLHGRQHQLLPAPHTRPPRRDEPRAPGQERGAGYDRGPGARGQRPPRGAHRLRDEYLRNVSHEFRSPLTVIRGYAEFVRDQGVPPDRPCAT